jgi:hypothetical protein
MATYHIYTWYDPRDLYQDPKFLIGFVTGFTAAGVMFAAIRKLT